MQLQTVKSNSGLALITSETDRKAVEVMLPERKRLIEAALQPKINILPPVDVVLSLNEIISITYNRAGYKMPDAATLSVYASELHAALLEKFPTVTLPEIREALKQGVYGEYGDFTGINPKTCMQFIRGYLTNTERLIAREEFEAKRFEIKMQQKLTPEERENHNKDFVNHLYADYLIGALLTDFIPGFLYDFLVSQGKLLMTSEEKRVVHGRAKAYFLKLKCSPRYSINRTKSISDHLATYVAVRNEEITVKNIAKQFAIGDYFTTCQKAGLETIF